VKVGLDLRFGVRLMAGQCYSAPQGRIVCSKPRTPNSERGFTTEAQWARRSEWIYVWVRLMVRAWGALPRLGRLMKGRHAIEAIAA